MQKHEFAVMVSKLCSYYERKSPSQSTLDLWMQRVQHYPSETLPWMIEAVMTRFEKFPPNLPNVLRTLWSEWLRDNPDKYASDQRDAYRCSDPWCREFGEGLIHAWKVNERNETCVYLFRCKTCGGNGYQAFPSATAGELTERGYQLDTIPSALSRVMKPKSRDAIRLETQALMGRAADIAGGS